MPLFLGVLIGVYLAGLALFLTYTAVKVLVVKYAMKKMGDLDLDDIMPTPRPDQGQYL